MSDWNLLIVWILFDAYNVFVLLPLASNTFDLTGNLTIMAANRRLFDILIFHPISGPVGTFAVAFCMVMLSINKSIHNIRRVCHDRRQIV